MTKMSHSNVWLIYLGILFFLYPVIAHTLMYELNIWVDVLPHTAFWVLIQVLLSSPMLILLGLLLYFKYGSLLINKILGALSFVIGFIWFIVIVKTIIGEAS